MPILDPSLQYYLSTHYSDVKSSSNSDNSTKDFFLRYLKIASTNIYRNINTVTASIQFKNDLETATPVLNQIFGSNFTFENDFSNPTIKNCYSYLYSRIKPELTKNISKMGFTMYIKIYFKLNYSNLLQNFQVHIPGILPILQ